MREWNLKSGDPLCLTLACDARLVPTDYVDDQIWELQLGGGVPPALSLNTTYGLRAKSARISLRFGENDEHRQDPDEFAHPPEARQVFPNFVSLAFSPFEGIDVVSEVWVPHSHAIAGRVQIANNARFERKITPEVIGQLAPVDGQRMAPFEMSAATLLTGLTSGLAPVLFVTGGAKAGTGPYASLALAMQLNPGEERAFFWAQAALAERDASFAMARDLVAQNWEALKSRIEMLNAGHVEIFSGEPAWDAAFMLAQKQAASLLVGPAPALPQVSLVSTRQPDQGFSLRGDGADYNHLWNGQTALEADYLARILLPAAPEQVKGLLLNFLAVQAENGEIDAKPGLAGQRSGLLAPPLLAGLAWRIYQQTEDRGFLAAAFDPLLRFVQSWFTPEHDRDHDGVPELDHPIQTGLDYHPVYSRWQSDSAGVDIHVTEGPALGAMLFHECRRLAEMAKILDRPAEVETLEQHALKLGAAVEAAWDESSASYYDWDRDTHLSPAGRQLFAAKGSGIFYIRTACDPPARLLIEIHTDETVRRRPIFFIHGKGAAGNNRVERIEDDQFRWMPGLGQLTGRYVYSRLERVEVSGLEAEDSFQISSLDFRTQTLIQLAPLWAGIPDPERAEKILAETLGFPAMYWREFGLPLCLQAGENFDQQACWSVNLPWNVMIADGLLRYGYRAQAAELLARLMAAIVNTLKKERTFRRSFNAETGQPAGEFNSLSGLAPLGLFLETLGVRLISSKKVGLTGFNPFPWLVTVKYRGITILRQKDKTIVIFPDSQTVTVTDPEPRIVSLEVQ
jgi:hypothetical protein